MAPTLTLAAASSPIVRPLVVAMSPIEIGLRVLAGVLLILINAYFVAVEFGLTRLRQYPASEIDTPALKRAWEMTDDLEFYLTTCQVWISGTSIALGVVAEPGLAAPPMTLSPEVSVSDAYDQFQAQTQELALVVEDGTVVGLVTATDALEAVMGQLEDPLDADGS